MEFDLFLATPHTPIDADSDMVARLADLVGSYGLAIGSCVAPVWPDKGGGSAMGDANARAAYVDMVRKACGIGRQLRERGVRAANVIRIDSAVSPEVWARDPSATKTIATTIRQAAVVAADYGERLALEGEICWGGMHSWRHMLDLLEAVGRPDVVGFQADMAHTLLYAMGYNAPEHALVSPSEVRRARRRSKTPWRSSPPPSGPGRSIFTSRRTTARSKAWARTTKRDAIACPTTRSVCSTYLAMPVSGCATVSAS